MNWFDTETTDIDVGVDKAFTVISEGPPTQATRQIKSKTAKEDNQRFEEAEKKLRLSAYPPLYTGEPEQYRLRRADAFEHCWNHLSQQIQVGL